MMAGSFHRTRCEIHSRNFCTAARELQKVCTHATANFKQTLPGKIIEAHDFRHPRRVLLVTMPLDFVEEFARAELVLATVNRAGRIVRPLLPRAILFISGCHDSGRYAAVPSPFGRGLG